MKLARYILLDPDGGYPYGVVASHANGSMDELHGPFATVTDAAGYRDRLRAEFSDYADIRVVKIETPAA